MSSKTFDALWDEYKPRKVRGKKTEAEIIRTYERYIRPILGGKRVNKISYKMIDDLHQTLRDTPYQANRVLSLIRPMFRFAGSLQWIEAAYNPAKDVPMFTERKRRRHIKPSEAPKIAEALYEQEHISPEGVLFIWLLIFTGARPSEIKKARWCDIIDDRIVLNDHKSVAKTGVDRIIALPPAAMEVIERLTEEDDRIDPFGEPTSKPIITIKNPEWLWRKIRVSSGCEDLRVYDIRHTFGTYALEKGFTLDQIGEALAHSNPSTTKIYAEMTDRSIRKISLGVSIGILEDMKIDDRQTPRRAKFAFRRASIRNPRSYHLRADKSYFLIPPLFYPELQDYILSQWDSCLG